MIVVTLVCVVLGGRLWYLRRMALFHDGKSVTSKSVADRIDHSIAAEEYREALKRPGLPVRMSVRMREEMRREADRAYSVILPNSSAPAPNSPKY